MRTSVRSIVLIGTFLSSYSFAIVSPWTGGTSYNPFGIPQGPRPMMSPPLYNPGPGNLAPAFSYVQQPAATSPQSMAPSRLNKDAKNVIGKWTLRADQFNSSPSKITDTVEQITKDRRVLVNTEKAGGLTAYDVESINQIKVLLNLAEVRALIKLVSTGQTGFPDAFAAIVGDTTTPNQTPLSKDWYDSKRNRLRILLTELQGFLSRRPEYAQNPPDLLVGLLTTCNDGREALDKYNQFCNCLESPNAKGCSTLAQPTKSDNQLRIRNRRDWRDDGSDLGDEE
jgi:hypothetical protein